MWVEFAANFSWDDRIGSITNELGKPSWCSAFSHFKFFFLFSLRSCFLLCSKKVKTCVCSDPPTRAIFIPTLSEISLRSICRNVDVPSDSSYMQYFFKRKHDLELCSSLSHRRCRRRIVGTSYPSLLVWKWPGKYLDIFSLPFLVFTFCIFFRTSLSHTRNIFFNSYIYFIVESYLLLTKTYSSIVFFALW